MDSECSDNNCFIQEIDVKTGTMAAELTADDLISEILSPISDSECSGKNCFIQEIDIEAGMMAAAMGEEGETDEDGNQNWFRVRVDKVVEVSPWETVVAGSAPMIKLVRCEHTL